MLVYILNASAVKSQASEGRVENDERELIRSYEEPMKDGREIAIGCNVMSSHTPSE